MNSDHDIPADLHLTLMCTWHCVSLVSETRADSDSTLTDWQTGGSHFVGVFNVLMLKVATSRQIHLIKSLKQKQSRIIFEGEMSIITLPTILLQIFLKIHFQFQSYCQKQYRSRRHKHKWVKSDPPAEC